MRYIFLKYKFWPWSEHGVIHHTEKCKILPAFLLAVFVHSDLPGSSLWARKINDNPHDCMRSSVVDAVSNLVSDLHTISFLIDMAKLGHRPSSFSPHEDVEWVKSAWRTARRITDVSVRGVSPCSLYGKELAHQVDTSLEWTIVNSSSSP